MYFSWRILWPREFGFSCFMDSFDTAGLDIPSCVIAKLSPGHGVGLGSISYILVELNTNEAAYLQGLCSIAAPTLSGLPQKNVISSIVDLLCCVELSCSAGGS